MIVPCPQTTSTRTGFRAKVLTIGRGVVPLPARYVENLGRNVVPVWRTAKRAGLSLAPA